MNLLKKLRNIWGILGVENDEEPPFTWMDRIRAVWAEIKNQKFSS